MLEVWLFKKNEWMNMSNNKLADKIETQKICVWGVYRPLRQKISYTTPPYYPDLSNRKKIGEQSL